MANLEPRSDKHPFCSPSEDLSGMETRLPRITSSWDELRHLLVEKVNRGFEENRSLIRMGSLDDGWNVVRHRASVVREVMSLLMKQTIAEFPPSGRCAVHLLGGSGRGEMCPDSDVDFGVIVENLEENEEFLKATGSRIRSLSSELPGLQPAFKANAIQDLSNRDHFNIESLLSLLDGRLIAGDSSFHSRIRETLDVELEGLGLELVFFVLQTIREFEARFPEEPGEQHTFDLKHGKGGLRNFQLPVWIYGAQHSLSSEEVYSASAQVKGPPSREVLDAVGVLFMVRSWFALERRTPRAAIEHQSPVVRLEDLMAFRERFGNEAISKLEDSRHAILRYRREIIDNILDRGIAVPGTDSWIEFGSKGLFCSADSNFSDPVERFYRLQRASLRLQLKIEEGTQSSIRKHIPSLLTPDGRFLDLISGRGKISFLIKEWLETKLVDCVVPHFSELRQAVYDPNNRLAVQTPARRSLQRLQNLDALDGVIFEDPIHLGAFFAAQFQALDNKTLALIRFSLLVKDIPEMTGISGKTDNDRIQSYCSIAKDIGTLSEKESKLIYFLLSERENFVRDSERSGEADVIAGWLSKLEGYSEEERPDLIRALALITYACFDFPLREEVGSNGRLRATQWQGVCNFGENLLHALYKITGNAFSPGYLDKLGEHIGSYLPERLLLSPFVEKHVVKEVDREVLDSRRALHIINRLAGVAKSGEPQILVRNEGGTTRVDIFALNKPGLFWKIAQAFHRSNCEIKLVDLHNVNVPPLAGILNEGCSIVLDVVTIEPPKGSDSSVWLEPITQVLKETISDGENNDSNDLVEILSRAGDALEPRLTDLGSDRYKLSFHVEDKSGVLYAATRILSEKTEADIYSISLDGTVAWAVPRFNIYFISEKSYTEVSLALSESFRC